MDMEEFMSATELAVAIRSKDLSPLEAMDACLEKVDQLNGSVNAVIWCDDQEAREKAKQATDRLLAAGDPSVDLPPFHGVPIPIKDLTKVRGWPITYGSWAGPKELSSETELVVRAFEDGGFVLAGRTNTPELGPLPVSENLRYGITRNPWDLARTPGGSSGGSAAAVASGMFPIAHGNDGGGSLRIPASCCGLVGLKPSRGRVPAMVHAWEGAAVEGVVTTTVADTAAVLDCMARFDPFSWYNAPQPSRPFVSELGAPLRNLRIALSQTPPLGLTPDPECMSAVEEAGTLLESLGHSVEPFEGDLVTPELVGNFVNMVNGAYAEYPIEDVNLLEPHNRTGLALARDMDCLQYRSSILALERASREIVSLWASKFDVLVTPTMAIQPPPAGYVMEEAHRQETVLVSEVLSMTAYTAVFNVTGQPAISLPLGMSESGLPIGVQFVGGPWAEGMLIRLASQIEQAAPWSERHAPLR